MEKSDIKCRVVEEELRSFWPQWHVVRRLGGGAFGDVFQIYKDDIGVRVDSALKVIQIVEGDEDLLVTDVHYTPGDSQKHVPQMLENEIQIMETLRGAPNIVAIEDFYYRETAGIRSLYVRMELLTSFQDILRNLKNPQAAPLPSVPAPAQALTIDNIVKIGKDICTALMYCERRGIIHRDIKPANLFVDSFGNYKVGDFGASKRTQTMSMANTLTGTISYMAPEIFTGNPYNKTVDIYALGLVLYQLLNSVRMPFLPTSGKYTAADIDSANYRRIHGAPIPPLTGNRIGDRVVDARLDAIIRRACMPDPADRYRSAGDFYNALNQYVNAPDRGMKDWREPAAVNTFRNVSPGSTWRQPAAPNINRGSAVPASIPNPNPVPGNTLRNDRTEASANKRAQNPAGPEKGKKDHAFAIIFGGTILFIALIGAIIGFWLSREVYIPDPVLRKAIQEELSLGDQKITRLNTLYLTEIDYTCENEEKIYDLTGLSAFKNLVIVYLDGSEVSDLTPLSNLKQLVGLSLEGNNVEDLSPISELPSLIYLNLGENEVNDISALSGMKEMQKLFLEGNRISDITPLSGMTKLESLYLAENPVLETMSHEDIMQVLSGAEKLHEYDF